MSVRVVSNDGTILAVGVDGPRDAPAVVLVHGLGLSSGSWRLVAARLTARHRVIVYDLRGHGRSGRATGGDYGIAAHAADLDAGLAATVSPAMPAVIAGHSLGGEIILERAVTHLMESAQ
jgi:pimeloyl-ACP methyl ester carboxylesterase